MKLWLLGALLLWCSGLAAADSLDREAALHFLKRTTLSFSRSDLEQVMSEGAEERLRRELTSGAVEGTVLRGYLSRLSYQQLTPRELYLELLEESEATTMVEEEMLRARILRGLLSEHQLREVMTDFWFNHFNADPDKGEVVACNVVRLEGDLRRHAFGSFRQILEVAVKNPAVLENLDNTVSDGRAVNENFGRELVELYTTGPIHTQQEVLEVSRCFSGWSYESDPSSERFLEFRYYPELHALGPKTVFGKVYGDHQQELVLDDLARHPATAEFISRKLVTRFVSDQPPPELVVRAAAVFRDADGDIARVLEVILGSAEFRAKEHHGRKFKTPIEFVVAALAHSLDSSVLEDLVQSGPRSRLTLDALAVMGSPYSCPNPLGWPDEASVWTSLAGQRRRWVVAQALSRGARLESSQGVARARLYDVVSPSTLEALKGLEGQASRLHAAALSSPEFQSR